MYDNEELACLLAEAQKGNKQAFGNLLAQLRPWMRRQVEILIGRRHHGDWWDGSDIVSEGHLRMLERFDQFRGAAVPQLRAWIKTILRRIIDDQIRKKKVKKDGDAHLSDVPADGTTPSKPVIEEEEKEPLIASLQRLPEKYRLVLQLRIYDGLPFEDVAQKAGVTAGNARVLMVRAIERLKKELGDKHES
jgi:RNA polymerase sigma-70 factor, ECF subfamily